MNWKQFFKPLRDPKVVFWLLIISAVVAGVFTWLDMMIK